MNGWLFEDAEYLILAKYVDCLGNVSGHGAILPEATEEEILSWLVDHDQLSPGDWVVFERSGRALRGCPRAQA